MSLNEAFRRSPVLKSASANTRTALTAAAHFCCLTRGEQLFLERTEQHSVYFLDQGTAALYRTGPNQEKKVLFICSPGDMLNEELVQASYSSSGCEALSDSRVLWFPADVFFSFCATDAALSRAVMESMALKLRRLYRQMRNTCNTVRLDRQLASRLIRFSHNHGVSTPEGVEIDFDLPISYLADILGARRESVSRQVKLLGELNLIALRNGRFIILDMDGLKAYYQTGEKP